LFEGVVVLTDVILETKDGKKIAYYIPDGRNVVTLVTPKSSILSRPYKKGYVKKTLKALRL